MGLPDEFLPHDEWQVERLGRWREELQSDVVRISERETRTVGRVNDSTMFDPKIPEAPFPGLQVGSARYRERNVVEARSEFAGLGLIVRRRMSVQTEESSTI